MKTNSVSELSSYFTAAAGSQLAGSAGTAAGESFSKVMNQAGAGKNAYDVQSRGSGPSSADSSKGRSAEAPNEIGSADRGLNRIKDAAKDPDRGDVGSKVKEVTDEVVSELKEQLNVTDEDIEEAMEVLGLTMADLLDRNALSQLFTELSGKEDAMAVITDENLFSGLQDILDRVQVLTDELKNELGLTDEALKEALKTFSAQDTENAAGDSFETASEISEKETGEKTPVITVTDERTEKTDAGPEETESIRDIPGADAEKKAEKNHDNAGDGGNENFLGQGGSQSFNTAEVISETPVSAVSYSDTAGTQEIARQIIDQIEVRISEETTRMEMELNPASLGRVGLSIEARNGVITASFTAQNEAVRAAIESQVVQLQESLEKQGVKIEAVEVTVASHQFEQNLEKGNEQNERREEAQRAQAVSGRRRMNINLLDEDGDEETEEITEEEAINRDMMIRNGNSVDYTV